MDKPKQPKPSDKPPVEPGKPAPRPQPQDEPSNPPPPGEINPPGR